LVYQLQKQEGDLIQGNTYKNFVNAIKSPATRVGYENSLRRYLNYLRLTKLDDLLIHASNPRYIESQVIDYIMSLRESGLAYSTIQFLITAIFTFYQINDITLNKKKVSRYLGECKRVAKDGAYTTEQIQVALQTADARMTNREILEMVLKHGLKEEHMRYKDRIVELFTNMKDRVRVEDLRVY
jgi:hypothetical protein